MIFKRQFALPETYQFALDDRSVEILISSNARAKNYRLSLHPKKGLVLTIPKRGNWPDAEAFLLRQQNWLQSRMDRFAPPIALAPEQMLPLRGVPHFLIASGQLRGLVSASMRDEQPILQVPGAADHFTRRLGDWLKKEARHDLDLRVQFHANQLSLRPKGITIRDQSSRWGSCSSTGQLNFSWRLILAPDYVLDYVAAHEVAHLREMNHSPRFWRTVKETLPDMKRGHDWLKVHGRELMRYQLK